MRRGRARRVCARALALGLGAWALLGFALPPRPNAALGLRRGVFLVATEQLTHSSFRQTVILITHYGDDGAMGLTVNRPTEVTLGQAFPDVEALHGDPRPLFLGGPVSPHSVFVLIRSADPPASLLRVGGDVYFGAGMEGLRRAAGSGGSKPEARVFAGYAGWAPGQLEAEIARGDWVIAPEPPSVAFSKDVKKLWRRLLSAWSGRAI